MRRTSSARVMFASRRSSVSCTCFQTERMARTAPEWGPGGDRKSTRLNSSHEWISYAVFCVKKKKNVQEVVGTGALAADRIRGPPDKKLRSRVLVPWQPVLPDVYQGHDMQEHAASCAGVCFQ